MTTNLRDLVRRALSLPSRLVIMADGAMRGSPCPVCARSRIERRRRIISDALAAAWELSPEWRARFDEREGVYCPLCHSNRRSQQLAATLVRHLNREFGLACRSLRELASHPRFHTLSVAEMNACGQLHYWLARHPGLAYSEYQAQPPVRSEDLHRLTYADASFDLVLTSETLEHIPDLPRALAEIRRVLKPGGAHVFTTPVVWDRATSRPCARLGPDGGIEHLRPASFHGLPGTTAGDMMVIVEFGADIIALLERAGFEVRVEQDETNPALCTFITRRPA